MIACRCVPFCDGANVQLYRIRDSLVRIRTTLDSLPPVSSLQSHLNAINALLPIVGCLHSCVQQVLKLNSTVLVLPPDIVSLRQLVSTVNSTLLSVKGTATTVNASLSTAQQSIDRYSLDLCALFLSVNHVFGANVLWLAP